MITIIKIADCKHGGTGRQCNVAVILNGCKPGIKISELYDDDVIITVLKAIFGEILCARKRDTPCVDYNVNTGNRQHGPVRMPARIQMQVSDLCPAKRYRCAGRVVPGSERYIHNCSNPGLLTSTYSHFIPQSRDQYVLCVPLIKQLKHKGVITCGSRSDIIAGIA